MNIWYEPCDLMLLHVVYMNHVIWNLFILYPHNRHYIHNTYFLFTIGIFFLLLDIWPYPSMQKKDSLLQSLQKEKHHQKSWNILPQSGIYARMQNHSAANIEFSGRGNSVFCPVKPAAQTASLHHDDPMANKLSCSNVLGGVT